MHTSRLGTLPGELIKYFSVLGLHTWPGIRFVVRPPKESAVTIVVVGVIVVVIVMVVGVIVVVIVMGVVVVVVVVVVSGLVNEIASATVLVFVHAVLTWAQ